MPEQIAQSGASNTRPEMDLLCWCARTEFSPEIAARIRMAVQKDPEIRSRLSEEQIDRAFDLKRQLGNVDKIFDRVFSPQIREED